MTHRARSNRARKGSKYKNSIFSAAPERNDELKSRESVFASQRACVSQVKFHAPRIPGALARINDHARYRPESEEAGWWETKPSCFSVVGSAKVVKQRVPFMDLRFPPDRNGPPPPPPPRCFMLVVRMCTPSLFRSDDTAAVIVFTSRDKSRNSMESCCTLARNCRVKLSVF